MLLWRLKSPFLERGIDFEPFVHAALPVGLGDYLKALVRFIGL
jgi:hypothetical protein